MAVFHRASLVAFVSLLAECRSKRVKAGGVVRLSSSNRELQSETIGSDATEFNDLIGEDVQESQLGEEDGEDDQVEYTECPGLHETTCGTNLNWHQSVGVRTDATKRCVPGYARTGTGDSIQTRRSCTQWCEERGFVCLRAQDVVGHDIVGGRCNLNPEHTRQTTEENGCLQTWNDQVCECGLTTPQAPPAKHMLVKGCSRGRESFANWGSSRMEFDHEVAGEAVCCNENGKAARHIKDGVAVFVRGERKHEDCTTASSVALDPSSDSPSHTYHAAERICQGVGLRLCRTQEEVDTSCSTGCYFNPVQVWIDQA